MMDYESVSAEIKACLSASLGLSLDSTAINNDEPLWGGRFALGSLAAIEFLTALEERFGVQFPDKAIDMGLLGSVHDLADALISLLPHESSTVVVESSCRLDR